MRNISGRWGRISPLPQQTGTSNPFPRSNQTHSQSDHSFFNLNEKKVIKLNVHIFSNRAGGWGGEHANHRCVQVDEEGGPGNNFLGHEISFYGGEILLGQPVWNHLFKISLYIFIRNSGRKTCVLYP